MVDGTYNPLCGSPHNRCGGRAGETDKSNLGTASRSDPYITGEGNRSAIGTLVERSTRYVMLLHLPTDHTAEAVRDALTRTVLTLPAR